MTDWRFLLRVVFKATVLFALLNLVFAWAQPDIGSLSIYNRIVPGRVRLPYSDDTRSYNLTTNDLSVMFHTHEITQHTDQPRIIFLGDSATWGTLLEPDETLPTQFETLLDRGQAYNLAHPITSATKDLLILDYAMRYEPDAIIWMITLNTLARDAQLDAPLVQANMAQMHRLAAEHDLNLATDASAPTLLERSIVGQRQDLADWLRLQLYGVMWRITGIDQYIPTNYERVTTDLDPDICWQGICEPRALENLAFEVLAAGHAIAGDTPVLLVNEPIFISDGANSDLRYNSFYPRWAYDAYRDLLAEQGEQNDWQVLDMWDAINPNEFTDTPLHLTPKGIQTLATTIQRRFNLPEDR